ncbi:MAG: hypothetical protein EBU49_02460 [Proteobacteria bacterium]|nr:hypothetical protein [Pseudomonadota bacterium]
MRRAATMIHQNQSSPNTRPVKRSSSLNILFGLMLATGTHARAMPNPDGKSSTAETPPPVSSGALEVPKATPDPGAESDDGRLIPIRKKMVRRGREPRIWSIGARAGSLGNTGVLAQYVGEGDVAWNVGINLMDYEGKNGVGLTIERLVPFDEGFYPLAWPTLQKWDASRGKIVYLTGFGIQMDSQGLFPRLPVGAQYTMAGDPVTWSAQATLFIGQVLGTKPGIGLGFAPEIGVRYVLE